MSCELCSRVMRSNGMSVTFGSDATTLRLNWLRRSLTQRSRSGNVGLEVATALRLNWLRRSLTQRSRSGNVGLEVATASRLIGNNDPFVTHLLPTSAWQRRRVLSAARSFVRESHPVSVRYRRNLRR